MAEDKDTKDQGSEEYQYSGEEFGIADEVGPQEFQAPTERTSGLPGILGRKFVVPILVIVATVILYLWMTLTGKPTEEAKDIGGAEAIKAKLSQSTTPVESSQTPVVVTEESKEITQTEPEPMSVALPEQATATPVSEPPIESAKINELSASMNQLQTTVGDLGKAMVTLSAKLDEVEKLGQTPAPLRANKSVKSNAYRHSAPRAVPRMIYVVKAVVPGRAWIQSRSGGFTSIEVGETLGGYGKVESIDVAEGSVKLSSGATIQYGLYDR